MVRKKEKANVISSGSKNDKVFFLKKRKLAKHMERSRHLKGRGYDQSFRTKKLESAKGRLRRIFIRIPTGILRGGGRS